MFAWLKSIFGGLFYAKHIDPQVIVCSDYAQAGTAAATYAAADPSFVLHTVADTGSMQPLIPKQNCFLVTKRIPFTSIRLGTVCTYAPTWAKTIVVHRLAAKDGLGFIGSGDNNPRSEAAWRITPDNFEGEVQVVWTYPLPATQPA